MKHWVAALASCLAAADVPASGDCMPPTIEQVKAAHERALLARPGVVSVGIGRDEQGRPAIMVGVDGPRPKTQALLPRALEGYPVRTEIVGTMRAR